MSWLAAAIGLSSNFTYYLKTTGPAATVPLLLLQVLMWGFLILRARGAVLRWQSWWVVFVYPTLCAAVGTLVFTFSPHGTWGSFAYTQMDALPVIQLASAFGAPAVTFVVALFSSTVSVALYRGAHIQRPWLAYGISSFLIAAALLFGIARLAIAPVGPRIRVGLASVDDFIGPRMPAQLNAAVWQRYAEIVGALAKDGARMVVLPEKISALPAADIENRQLQLASLARSNHIYLVAGLQLNHPDRKDNALWLFNPEGELVTEYHKQHLVPYLENDLTPGHQDSVSGIEGSNFGLAICRDLFFTHLGRHYGRLGVSAVLVPGWDFYRDAWMASGVAALVGVENGYAVVRAGRESYLNVSERYGRTIARKRSENLPGASLIADLPLGPAKPTLYARFGDVFGWLCVALSVWFLVRLSSGTTLRP